MRHLFGPGFFKCAACGLLLAITLFATTPDDASRARLDWLRSEVARHDELYFKKSAPEISDTAYDLLKRELRELEARFPDAAASEAGAGDDRTPGFRSYRHREKMLSLNKAYSEAEVRAFYARLAAQLGAEQARFTVEPKYDGLAISLTYERGEWVRAVTRGDGVQGDDVTANLRALVAVPPRLRAIDEHGEALPVPDRVEIRGEVYLTWAEFARINREREAAGEEPFSHLRNLAAGTLKQTTALDAAATFSPTPTQASSRRLSLVLYGIGAWSPVATRPASQHALHGLIRAWGLPGLDFREAGTLAELWRAVTALGEARGRLPFPIDGVVVKLDSVAGQQRLGSSESAPNWAVAYKFSAEQAETRLKAITIQVGRTGVLTPVAELEPVELAGSKIARASLHNREEIARKDFRVGDFVYVEKAGEIIPAVVGVNRARREATAAAFVFPETCPVCATPVAGVSGEAAVRCPNYACPAQVQRRIEHFASKEAVNIAGLGPAMIEKLVARGWVKTPADLYRLKREDLLTLGANVAKSTDRLLASIEASRRAEAWRFVYGLGIPQVGPATARELTGKCGDLAALAGVSSERLIALGVNRPVANSVAAFFARPESQAWVRALIEAGAGGAADAPVSTGVVTPGPLAGKVVVFTGTLTGWDRAVAAERVRAAGGIVRDSVSGQTDFLVAGKNGGAKVAAARELKVKIIDEAELLRLLGAP